MKPIMDPSKKFGFNLDFDKFWWKLKIILLVFCLNSLSILSLMMAAHYFLDEKTIFKIVADYIVRQWIFFTEQNWTNFSLFFKTYCIKTPIIEEFIYRYPVILLLNNRFSIRLFSLNLTKIFILFTVITLNIMWGIGHTGSSLLLADIYGLIPLFLVGLTLYWLSIKTRTLWPSIFCHAALNFSLYLFIQGAIYFEFKPVIGAIRAFYNLPNLPGIN